MGGRRQANDAERFKKETAGRISAKPAVLGSQRDATLTCKRGQVWRARLKPCRHCRAGGNPVRCLQDPALFALLLDSRLRGNDGSLFQVRAKIFYKINSYQRRLLLDKKPI